MPGPPLVAVLFALPEESKVFRRLLSGAAASGRNVELVIEGRLGEHRVLLAHTGVGATAAAARTAKIIAQFQPAVLISAGFAGGLQPTAVPAAVVIDDFGRPVSLPAGCLSGRVVSADHVVEAAMAKAALGRETQALAVDMETAAIAAAAEAAGLRMLAVRTISDPVDADLPVPMAVWFDAKRNVPRPLSLVLFLLRHPSRIPPFARFVLGLTPAREALARALQELIPQLATPPL
jgi:adenosylhomocysteine nucleosidase